MTFASSQRQAALAAVVCFLGSLAQGQTPPASSHRLPPAGIAISAADRADLTSQVEALGKQIDALKRGIPTTSDVTGDWIDVEVFRKAVDWALRYDEFFDAKQVAFARHLLSEGRERAKDLQKGNAPWFSATGLVIRAYQSQIDGSIQPFGLVVPSDYAPVEGSKNASPGDRRLDVVLSGRNEKRSELAFIAEHEKGPGEIVPNGAILLYPYGRFCNATKFAGEVDVFESMEAVLGSYPIDPNRIVLRGFSMGGASVWHLATHHSGEWCAASPGAGFAETPIYTKAFAPGKEKRPWWEQKLWNWYDAAPYAANLFNCPTIAYSGEIDPQKQSADIMEKAMAGEGLKLERLIGPKTAHKYEPATKAVLAERLTKLSGPDGKGGPDWRDNVPDEIHVTTYTLQYPRVGWVTIDGLGAHWSRADVTAKRSGSSLLVQTRNVTAVSFDLVNFSPRNVGSISIDGQTLNFQSDPGKLSVHVEQGKWALGPLPAGIRKHGATEVTGNDFDRQVVYATNLTGPVDDAFMSAFVFVRPTGKPLNPVVGTWVQRELVHAKTMWRDIFRGDAPVEDDTAVSDEDIESKNLVLWGDPSSNQVLRGIIGRLPLSWNDKELIFNGRTYDASHHAPILIFPNPLNPAHYIVLNSGMDLRDEAYGTNALQDAKLPDWAIVDLSTPPGPRWPGRIADAGFFNEGWNLQPSGK